jgi:hypothetical protein
MQQPPDPYSQFQQPYNAPTSPYAQPPPYNYNAPPKRTSGFRHWFRMRSRNTKIGLGCGTIIAALLLCICAASAYGSANVATTLTPTPTTGNVTILNSPTVNIPTDTPTLAPTPTQKPTPIPTLKPSPKPQPTQPACQAVNNNPWCYNFNPGNLIYNPPSAFCDYFTCVSTFWTATSGYVAECAEEHYTHSGGVRGACSHNGGVLRPLYSH